MMKLIQNWREGWKFYSAWAIAVLGALPDLYNLIAAAGMLDAAPSELVWTIRLGAVLALVSRFISQHRPADPSDQAGA